MNSLPGHRAQQIERGEEWESLEVKGHWFHVVRDLVQAGVIADVGPVAWAIYCVVKAHTNLKTGDAWPSNERIGELIGKSVDTVQLGIKKLTQAGLLEVVKTQGKPNRYAVIEKIAMATSDGQHFASAEAKYIPATFSKLIEEVQRAAKTGNAPGDKNITINVTLNVQNIAPGATGIINAPAVVTVLADHPIEEVSDIHRRLRLLG